MSTQPSQPAFDLSLRAMHPLEQPWEVPPFSVLDARQGYWRERKDAWMEVGIRSEEGRDSELIAGRSPGFYRAVLDADDEVQSTSIFDPVLCEAIYRWWSKPGGKVLDPFAGGSVRGIVAGVMGREYTGVDLNGEQIRSNAAQSIALFEGQMEELGPIFTDIFGGPPIAPVWYEYDSRSIAEVLPERKVFDAVISCPPYGDLEEYTGHVDDISALGWDGFGRDYALIIANTVKLLKPGGTATFVVGNYRDTKTGFYRDLVGLTVRAFEAAGAYLYNDIVLITPVGSLPRRASRFMRTSRKVGKGHQNVLVFVKGRNDEPLRGWEPEPEPYRED